MRKQTLLTVLAATMLVLAGCSGGTPADGGASPDDGTADGEDGADGTNGDTAMGTVEFYVSDQPGRMDDFRHLNVTIDRIGFERADGGSDATPTVTMTATNATNATTTATATATNATATATAEAEETDSEENESEDSEAEETEAEADESEEADAGGKVVRDVDARSVDLTQLRGANATLIGTPQIPAGNYTKVTVYISEVNATLQDGSSANVKLPSNTLKLTKGFSLAANGSVQFVYDISVFEAGNSGKYILKPVISESGPDQDVRAVGGSDDDGSDDAEADGSDADDDSEESDDDDDETEAPAGNESNGGGPPDDRGN